MATPSVPTSRQAEKLRRDGEGEIQGPLLKFFLGPVQPFIEGARSVRDLWTGSYLLSYLTFAAMEPIIDQCGEDVFLSPSVKDSPFLWLLRRRGASPADLTIACLPNHFVAHVRDGVDPDALASACVEACRDAWLNKIASRVREAIEETLAPRYRENWARLWDDQVRSFFEIRAVVLPSGQPDGPTRERLLGPSAKGWLGRMHALGGLMDAARSVRHVPNYRANGDVPQKCSLLGTYEQMGPAPLDASREFWEEFSRSVRIEGERTRKGERLCAISLVKRFAWPAYISKRLHKTVNALSYSDTALIAAAPWLRDSGQLAEALKRGRGPWLHWHDPKQEEEDEPCPDDTWRRIQSWKDEHGAPPTYYGLVMMDADFLGSKLKEAPSPERALSISSALMRFARERMPSIVGRHSGQTIYAGGDDLLALLPAASAVSCAQEVSRSFTDNWKDSIGDSHPATISAGIAIVHYKEDLRFAVQQARAAGHAVKHAGRNAVALTVCRHSGEHPTVIMGWDQAPLFTRLVDLFGGEGAVSDRWAYKLRAELPGLESLPWEAVTSEVGRLLARSEGGTGEKRRDLLALVPKMLATYRGEMERRQRSPAAILDGFATLCQSASLVARGRDA